jgi:DNA-binding NtrC family response regulator
VLIADDQQDVLEALRLLLKGEGFEADTVKSPGEVIEAIEVRDYDALLMDMNYTRDTTSGVEGLDLLSRVRAVDNKMPVIVITAWGRVEGVVEAMRRGAKDYIEKPWDDERLIATLRTQIELGRALRHSQLLEGENERLRKRDLPDLIAGSPAMRPVMELMERIAPSEANVLIFGEHGTGKEVAARWIHAASERAQKPLVTVNVGGLSEGVFESEIFGHVRGAFTDAKADRVGCFELADGGTLFLDEIANIGPKEQAKLLRVIETGELQRVGSSKLRTVDVRILSATNADLRADVEQGRFREDLLYRLNTVEIRLPPLRERREDIPALADYYLHRLTVRYRKNITGFDPAALAAMSSHQWPGNIRELAHVVERAILMASDDKIHVDDLGLVASAGASGNISDMTLDEAEKELIENALKRFDGNVSDAAQALGVSRSALYRRLQRHGL